MTTPGEIPPEQTLCLSCGLCCDGTLFASVPLGAEEKDFSGNPVVPGPAEKRFLFMQPCGHYRDGGCRIYPSGRPKACVDFRCKLLHRYLRSGLSFGQAALVIRETRILADKLWMLFGDRAALPLAGLFAAWKESQETSSPAGWKKTHRAFLLDYAALRWRLSRHFQKNNDIMPLMERMPESKP
jgi:hypothetical protein